MADDFDGFATLAAMAGNPTLFDAGRADAAKAARAIAVKQIKVRGLPLARLRDIRTALGSDTYAAILDGMKEAEIKTLAKRLDGHNADVKSMSGADARRHLLALSDSLAPAERAVSKPARAPRAPKATGAGGSKSGAGRTAVARESASDGRTLTSEAMAARSPRRRGTEG